MNKRFFFCLLIFFLFLLERISKYIALHYLGMGLFCCHDFFSLKLFFNPGIAFGFPLPQVLSLLAALIIIIALLTTLIKHWRSWPPVKLLAIQLVIIGAISNLLDRIWLGQVIDFVQLGNWSIFNLADVYIMTGILILIILGLKKYK